MLNQSDRQQHAGKNQRNYSVIFHGIHHTCPVPHQGICTRSSPMGSFFLSGERQQHVVPRFVTEMLCQIKGRGVSLDLLPPEFQIGAYLSLVSGE